MNETIIQQGKFVSDGLSKLLIIRSDIDWIKVNNKTVLHDRTPNCGAIFYWDRQMEAGNAVVTSYNAAGTEMFTTTADSYLPAGIIGGFTLVNTQTPIIFPKIAITASTNAVQPVISTTNTGDLETGSIIRFYNIANQYNLSGIDFEIDNVVYNTSFRIRYALANAPGHVGGAGYYSQINPFLDVLPVRYIANIQSDGYLNTVVTTTIANLLYLSDPRGVKVRFNVPSEYGMTEINNKVGTVVSAAGTNFTVDIDSRGFTPFRFPVTFDQFTPAQVTIIGTNGNPILYTTSTCDAGLIGIRLAPGPRSPAGTLNDKIHWIAGKSFNM